MQGSVLGGAGALCLVGAGYKHFDTEARHVVPELYCIVLYCIVLYIVLYCILYCIVLYIVLYCIVYFPRRALLRRPLRGKGTKNHDFVIPYFVISRFIFHLLFCFFRNGK